MRLGRLHWQEKELLSAFLVMVSHLMEEEEQDSSQDGGINAYLKRLVSITQKKKLSLQLGREE